MIKKRQKQILDYLKSYKSKRGYSPSMEEIKKHLRLSSVSTVHYHIEALKNLGFLKKEDNQARAIDVYDSEQMIQIPLLGKIAAGLPIEVVEEKEIIAIPKNKLPEIGDYYALKVEGESMQEENINNGDIVIIRKQPSAENGEKVVALINNSEVTLKKLYKEKGRIKLQPANPKFSPIYIDHNNLTIQGVVVDIVKQNNVESKSNSSFIKIDNNKKIAEKTCKFELPINQIICGDAIENLKKLPDKSIDLVVADPPYNLSKGSNISWKSNGSSIGFGGDWNKIMESWDNMSFSEYFQFTIQWINEIKRILKPTGSIWVFGTYHNIGIINTIFQILKMEIINDVIWYKRNSFPNLAGRRLTASHETLLWGHANGKRNYYFNYGASKDFFEMSDQLKTKGKQMRTVWDIPNNKEKIELAFGKHPTQKPIKVCKRIISIASKPGDIILSPFAGAGSECVAAKELKRKYIGFELDQQYVDIANKRLKHCTSNQELF
jgi:site-specific DNA-methyltransferase (adenine-specific)